MVKQGNADFAKRRKPARPETGCVQRFSIQGVPGEVTSPGGAWGKPPKTVFQPRLQVLFSLCLKGGNGNRVHNVRHSAAA